MTAKDAELYHRYVSKSLFGALSPSDKLILLALAFEVSEGKAFLTISNGAIKGLTGSSHNTISQAKAKLAKLGLVELDYGASQETIYFFPLLAERCRR